MCQKDYWHKASTIVQFVLVKFFLKEKVINFSIEWKTQHKVVMFHKRHTNHIKNLIILLINTSRIKSQHRFLIDYEVIIARIEGVWECYVPEAQVSHGISILKQFWVVICNLCEKFFISIISKIFH